MTAQVTLQNMKGVFKFFSSYSLIFSDMAGEISFIS